MKRFAELTLIVVFALVVRACVVALDQPQVLVNDLTGKCVEVRDPAAAHEGREPYTCDRLPGRYERVITPRERSRD